MCRNKEIECLKCGSKNITVQQIKGINFPCYVYICHDCHAQYDDSEITKCDRCDGDIINSNSSRHIYKGSIYCDKCFSELIQKVLF